MQGIANDFPLEKLFASASAEKGRIFADGSADVGKWKTYANTICRERLLGIFYRNSRYFSFLTFLRITFRQSLFKSMVYNISSIILGFKTQRD